MDSETRSRSSKRNSTACEHCRAARIRCQASEQPGVCERCLGLKRECISRARPRPRRWERKLGLAGNGHSGQSTGRHGAFRINYTIPVEADLYNNFETLQGMHDQAFDAILTGADVGTLRSANTCNPVNPSSPSSLANQFHPTSDIWRQPLFDIASAETLLTKFKSMISYLPFIALPDESSIHSLATTRPFTLLSILIIASGSTSVRIHALYDDEFRKALGLKYVSGGDNSLELLQGLLVYCAWHPFHLRPSNGRLVHCLRILADLIHNLHLDETLLSIENASPRDVTYDELEQIRVYLAYLYLVSTFNGYIVVWRGERDLPTDIPTWAGAAIDILQQNPQVEGDEKLVTLRGTEAMQGGDLIFKDLDHEYEELRRSMDHFVMRSETTRMQVMFVDVFLDCGCLLAFPAVKTNFLSKVVCFPPPLCKLNSATKKLRAFLDYVSELEDSSLLSFTINDWTRLIVVLTLSFRLSFPLPLCPDFDPARARSEIQLDRFLSKMSQSVDTPTPNDLLSTARSIIGLANSKYDIRLNSLGAPQSAMAATFGCPIMDANLRQSVEQWGIDVSQKEKLPLFQDIWATMTLGWGKENDTF